MILQINNNDTDVAILRKLNRCLSKHGLFIHDLCFDESKDRYLSVFNRHGELLFQTHRDVPFIFSDLVNFMVEQGFYLENMGNNNKGYKILIKKLSKNEIIIKDIME